MVMFTHDVTKCKKKIKGAADKNGFKNVTFKQGLNETKYKFWLFDSWLFMRV